MRLEALAELEGFGLSTWVISRLETAGYLWISQIERMTPEQVARAVPGLNTLSVQRLYSALAAARWTDERRRQEHARKWTPMEKQRPYLSPSQIGMFSRCGEQYRRRYIEGEILPPGIAMLKGTGIHRGAELNFRQKLETHQDLPAKDIVDASVAAFEGEIRGGGVLLDPEEERRGLPVLIHEATADVISMASCHATEQAPDYQPAQVETRFRMQMVGEYDLVGIVDLIDDQRRVVDIKTSGRRKSQDEADASVQLTTYAAAVKATTGEFPAECRFDTIVQTKTKCYRDVVSTERNVGDLVALQQRMDAIIRCIKAGCFPPAQDSSFWCSDKLCGYYRSCPYVGAARRLSM